MKDEDATDAEEDGACFPFARPQGDSEEKAHHRPASPEAEITLLRALKEALSNLPHRKKSELVHVQRVAPGLVDDDHLLIFLRGEGFDVEVGCVFICVRCVILLHYL